MVNAAGSLSSNLEDTSEIPAVAEPFFLEYDAKVTFSAVMNAQDLAKAAPGIEKAVKEHGQAIAA
jgi:enhancing lycopene biosynthesis protein 2